MKALISKKIVVNGNSEYKKSTKITIYFCGIPIFHSVILINHGE